MNNLLEQVDIKSKIYVIRGKQVMLDSDLAKLYHCKNGTKTINLAVKRHINRFPERYMFQLTEDEQKSLRFQSETLKNGRGEHKKYLPYVFSEQGVAMLATVLRTDIAEITSINGIGYKTFSITLMNDKDLYELLINKINKLTISK